MIIYYCMNISSLIYSCLLTHVREKMPDLTLSAYKATNDEVFPLILDMHVKDGSKIADVTYGRGTFGKRVDMTKYVMTPTDLKTGVDCRNLPYEDAEMDCVVFDPPYMSGFFRPKSTLAMGGEYDDFRQRYSTASGVEFEGRFYHAGVLDLYFTAGLEAKRVLRDGGTFIVKCQDEVNNHKQHLTHIEIVNQYAACGFYCKDLFVVVRKDTPSISRLNKQQHARKNHSYFLVFVKK